MVGRRNTPPGNNSQNEVDSTVVVFDVMWVELVGFIGGIDPSYGVSVVAVVVVVVVGGDSVVVAYENR